MADVNAVDKAEKELSAIKVVVEALKDMEDDSKRRVLGYCANLFDVNERPVAPPHMGAPGGPMTRSMPLPNVDPRNVRTALQSSGVPVRQQ